MHQQDRLHAIGLAEGDFTNGSPHKGRQRGNDDLGKSALAIDFEAAQLLRTEWVLQAVFRRESFHIPGFAQEPQYLLGSEARIAPRRIQHLILLRQSEKVEVISGTEPDFLARLVDHGTARRYAALVDGRG